MVSAEAEVRNRLGLHARPSAKLTQVATRFKSEIWITKNGRRVNAKSIMGVMMLAAAKGAKLLIESDGPDENEALAAVHDLVETGFGEIEGDHS